MVDRGVAVTILPKAWFGDCALMDSAGSRAGAHYNAANGEPMWNEGETNFVLSCLDGGNVRQMDFHTCDVNKAFGSVCQMVRNGNNVVFDSEEGGRSYILHKKTNGKMKLREHERVYVLVCLVAAAAEAAKIIVRLRRVFPGRSGAASPQRLTVGQRLLAGEEWCVGRGSERTAVTAT